jgi:mannan endo-1,4-beta-mannosidase
MPPCDPQADPQTRALLERLQKVGSSAHFLFGHQNTGWSSQQVQSRVVESDVSRATNGDFPAVVGFNLAQRHNHRLKEAIVIARQHGAVLTFSWEAPNPSTGGTSHDKSGQPMKELMPGGAANAQWESWLVEVAAYLRTVGAPVLFRPFHENTAETYWWGRTGCSADEFKAAWKYTQTRLWELGAHNLLFVYSPAKPDRDYQQAFRYRYPGNEALDIVAFDYYGANDISRGLASCCTQAATFAASQGKVAAIAEFGVFGGMSASTDDEWFITAFLRGVQSAPACARIAYALTWTNAATSYYVPLPGQGTYSGFIEF